MTAYPSRVFNGPTSLGDVFPTLLPDAERLVYEFLADAAGDPRGTGTVEDRISFPDSRDVQLKLPATFTEQPPFAIFKSRTGPPIPVVRGWPAYPGKIPAIGVASGTESDDQQHDSESGGFVGDLYAVDAYGKVIATAAYYSEAIYAPVIVQLLHENRDERDRLHNELRRVLFPLRRRLLDRDPQIRRVKVDAEKTEVAGGPPEADQPFLVYLSVFTVHVWMEMLEATDVTGPDQLVGSITVTVNPS